MITKSGIIIVALVLGAFWVYEKLKELNNEPFNFDMSEDIDGEDA